MKGYYIQDWGTFSNQTLVIVGHSKDEVREILVKIGTKKDLLKEWDDMEKDDLFYSSQGFVTAFENLSTILWLQEYDPKKWKDIDILAHETMHLIQEWSDSRGMRKEYEAEAYQFEYLFRNIRQTLTEKYEKWNNLVQKTKKRTKKTKSSS